jgi:hypothetical protein
MSLLRASLFCCRAVPILAEFSQSFSQQQATLLAGPSVMEVKTCIPSSHFFFLFSSFIYFARFDFFGVGPLCEWLVRSVSGTVFMAAQQTISKCGTLMEK